MDGLMARMMKDGEFDGWMITEWTEGWRDGSGLAVFRSAVQYCCHHKSGGSRILIVRRLPPFVFIQKLLWVFLLVVKIKAASFSLQVSRRLGVW